MNFQPTPQKLKAEINQAKIFPFSTKANILIHLKLNSTFAIHKPLTEYLFRNSTLNLQRKCTYKHKIYSGVREFYQVLYKQFAILCRMREFYFIHSQWRFLRQKLFIMKNRERNKFNKRANIQLTQQQQFLYTLIGNYLVH